MNQCKVKPLNYWLRLLLFSGVPACICLGAHWAQRVCLQAVLLSQDESRCGEDCHDPTTALLADWWTTGICGGGPVPRFRGERKGKMAFSVKWLFSCVGSWLITNMILVSRWRGGCGNVKENVFYYYALLFRRWRCPQLPSCSCESKVWSCVFGEGRRRSRPIWKQKLSSGTWWSKRCGLGVAWLTDTR